MPDAAHRSKTVATLDEAVQQAQNFGRWILLADALCARARWLAFFGSDEDFRHDLNQCREIAREHGFVLHQADLALLETQSALRRKERARAAKSLKEASQLIRKHGYKLRDSAVLESEAALKKLAKG